MSSDIIIPLSPTRSVKLGGPKLHSFTYYVDNTPNERGEILAIEVLYYWETPEPKYHIAGGPTIESLTIAGHEMGEFVETYCPEFRERIERAILETHQE